MKYLVFVLLLITTINLLSTEKEVDTLKTYRLGEIITESGRINKSTVISSVNQLKLYQLNTKDAASISDFGKYIPSALIQTNSRGETQLFLRGAGERQLGLFFDGVMLNVPWDNRTDLSTIPTDIVGRITINKGASSILYGPNIMGGALNISSLERKSQGYGFTLRSQFDDAGAQLYSITTDGRFGKLNYITNISYNISNGFLLPKDEIIGDETNQIQTSSLRTNTASKRLSFYGRAEYKFTQDFTTGISFNHYTLEKGVAPLTEGTFSDIRYWRYPEISRNILTLNSEYRFNDELRFNSVFWMDQFNQTIDSYTDLSYSSLKEKQKDDDLTLGTRLSLSYDVMKNHTITAAFNGFINSHNEIIEEADNVVINNDFSQTTISTGLQYKIDYEELILSAGASFDYNSNPETGEHKESEGLDYSDYGAFAGARYYLNDNIDLFINTSRRTRFPTMREAFSGALGKFIVNPDLKPETAWINELGTSYHNDDLQIELTAFTTLYDNLIEQIRDSSGKKMRVNFASAMISGVELSYSYNPNNSIFTNGYLTNMLSRGEYPEVDMEQLEYKPELMGLFNIGFKTSFGLTPLIELQYIGSQWGINPEEEWQELKAAMLLNLRLSYQLKLFDSITEIYIRANNLTDQLHYSKIGFVDAGRSVVGGFVVRM